MYRAVLDTCTLVPGLQRDFLLQLAAERSYQPLWGSGILFELDYVLAALDTRRGRTDSERDRRRLFERMKSAFPGAEIEAPKGGDYGHFDLNDPDDGHVAHAAVAGKADAIVTDDSRAGFTTSAALALAQIEVLRPHEFAANTVIAHPDAGIRAIRELAARRSKPEQSERELLEILRARYRMEEAADLLAAAL